jgi:CheY-like chemotaxis protein/anti-sigma regulatory factor (Ser/Thr protein kinase)
MSENRILLVEDEIIFAEIIEEVLTDAGFALRHAVDGQAAWEILEGGDIAFDAILLDRLMPRMDGIELLGKIKADPKLDQIPVIMETGAGDSVSVQEGLNAGAYYYLIKPFEPKVLLSIVGAAVAQYREHLAMLESVKLAERPFAFLDSGVFHFQTLEEGCLLADFFAHACPKPDKAILGLRELLINAVEHGNLGISYDEKGDLINDDLMHQEIARRLALEENRHKFVEVIFERKPDALIFTIRDQGDGFEWKRYLDFDPERVFDSNGRGIAMARTTSFDSIEYQGNGNTVVAKVNLVVNS